jgi:hypothetical protein
MSINRLLELHDLAKQESRKYDRKRFLFPQLMRDTGKHFTVLEGRPLEYWSESRPRGKVGVSGMTTPIIQWTPLIPILSGLNSTYSYKCVSPHLKDIILKRLYNR